MRTLYVVNESTVLSDQDAWRVAWSVDYQIRYHVARSPWGLDARVTFLPGGANAVIPRGGEVLHLLDTSDQQSALGYHDEDGNEVPFSRVFVKTAIDNGQLPSEVLSHEGLEQLVDPHVNLTALNKDSSRLYAVEVGDFVQGNGYDVGDPEGRKTGVVVADFSLPSAFDPNTPTDQPTSFRGSVKGPFTIAPQGYCSYLDMKNPSAGWTQQVGQEHKGSVSDPDDRLRRRGVSDGGMKGAKRKRARK